MSERSIFNKNVLGKENQFSYLSFQAPRLDNFASFIKLVKFVYMTMYTLLEQQSWEIF